MFDATLERVDYCNVCEMVVRTITKDVEDRTSGMVMETGEIISPIFKRLRNRVTYCVVCGNLLDYQTYSIQ